MILLLRRENSKKEKMLKKSVPNNKKLCPFLQEPFDDCYCVKMNSQDIEMAVYYCGKNFEACEIYKNGNGDNGEKQKIKSAQESFNKKKEINPE